MAEGVLANVAESIQKKLHSLELPLRGCRNDLEVLRHTLGTIQAMLIDLEPKLVTTDNDTRLLLRELQEVMYDTEDFLDDCYAQSLQQRSRPEVRIFFSSQNQLVYGRKVSRGIRDLNARLRENIDIIRRSDATQFYEQLNEPRDLQRILPLPPQVHEEEEEPVIPRNPFDPRTLVGRDADNEAIVETLMFGKCENNVGTVPIVVPEGVGKTWLAQVVFNDERIKRKFYVRLWVTLGVKVSAMEILKKIDLESSYDLFDDTANYDRVHDKIRASKFLLVLDDVWDDDYDGLRILMSILKDGYRGSRILLTTRLSRVARATNPIRIHYLRGLSEAGSWSLFKRVAFRRGQVPTDVQRNIGKELISFCGGNPMAIRVIGSMLCTKISDSEWSSFMHKFPRGRMIDVDQSRIFSVLEIIFKDLPYQLKQCFACCSLFPKNHKISVPKLINLWMAQGFVRRSESSPCLEAVGLSHFMDLLRRSFLEEVEKDEFGNVVSCKMNNSMHDLATKLVGTEFILFSEGGRSIEEKSRHAAFFISPTNPFEVPLLLLEARKMRTFLLMNETRSHLGALEPGCRLKEQQIDLIASNLGVLRVLDLHSSSISRVPSSVCKLKLLTYLDLSENKLIKVLPNSITRLLSLQILNLDNCEMLKRLPKDTKVLANLIHLGIENCSALTHMPNGIGRLTSLSTLSRFVIPIDRSISKYGSLDELRNLNDLRGTLKIYNLPHAKGAEFRATNLQAKKDLRLLRLEWSDGDEDHNDYDGNDVGDDQLAAQALEPNIGLKMLELRGYRGSEFPSWLPSLTNLVGLSLESCEKCQRLPPLDQLNHLKSLVIEGLTSLKYVHDGESGGVNSIEFFPSLKKLVLSDCPELRGWWKPSEAIWSELGLPCLSRLSHLSIMACPKLSSISMPVFPPLKSVKISDFRMEKLEQLLVRPEASSSSYSPSSLALSQLGTNIDDLVSFPEHLFENLESLKIF